MLQNLFRKKKITVIGLNSGTSADSLDLAAVVISFGSKRPQVTVHAEASKKYPRKLRALIEKALHDRIGSIRELMLLDRQLGIFYGEMAHKFNQSLGRRKISVDLVASHGQTVQHHPHLILSANHFHQSATLQLGHPESIAVQTGLVTVADFRQADIACGGEGAPITAYPMWLMLASSRKDRMVINIGGIANYFFFPAGGGSDKIQARDCGPGNSLLDIISQRYFKKSYDRDGESASRGKISKRLLAILLADPFLKGKAGISTGRERFGEDLVDKMVALGKRMKLDSCDILATAVELTASAISLAIRNLIRNHHLSEIYFFGGGLKNRFLMQRLAAYNPGIKCRSVRELGFNPDSLEAVCYGVLGALTVKSIRSGLPQVTGGAKKGIAGRIIQP